jgi:hypothetical protein
VDNHSPQADTETEVRNSQKNMPAQAPEKCPNADLLLVILMVIREAFKLKPL